jgi:hypothetical protein
MTRAAFRLVDVQVGFATPDSAHVRSAVPSVLADRRCDYDLVAAWGAS